MKKQQVDARSRDARRRILNTARMEIVKFGVAGASINRIAQEAGTSKERIYKYFKDKADLVTEVARERFREREDNITFRADNLLEYVDALFDYFSKNPEDVRLYHWLSLEGNVLPLPEDDLRISSLKHRVDLVRDAQKIGLVDASWDPLSLLNLLLSIALAWASAPMFIQQVFLPADQSHLDVARASAHEAARRLISPLEKS